MGEDLPADFSVETHRVQVAKSAIITPLDGELKVLLLFRADHDRNRPGDVDLPGGGLEFRANGLLEDPEEAMIRETREETGINIHGQVIQEIPIATTQPATGPLRHGYAVLLDESTPKNFVTDPAEHTGGGWFSRHDATRLFAHHTVWSEVIATSFDFAESQYYRAA
jgi:8-oxo-dGTP pyrophosphatase MutT (NUDIX family)